MNRGWIVAVAVALNIGFSTSVLGVTESIEGIFNASEGGNPTFNEIERIVINDYLAQPNDGEMGGAEKLTNPIPSLGSKKTAFLSSSVDSTHEKIALLEPGQILPVGVLKRPLPREIEARLPSVPHNYERVVVAGKALLIEKNTRLIADVLDGSRF